MAPKLALLFGIVFIIVGALGFVSNPIVGATGIFLTDTLHNLVHLIIGIMLVYVATKTPAKSSTWLKIFGVIYLLLAILGFLTISMGGELLGLVLMNNADHYLHVGLGVVLLLAGLVASDRVSNGQVQAPLA